MNKQVIVFDLDGVIINSVELMAELTRDSFPGIDHQGVKDLHKANIHESLRNSKLARRQETKEEFEKRQDIYRQKKLTVPLYAGIKDLLTILAKDTILVINTAASDKSSIPVLEFHGVHTHFSYIATKDVHASKVEKFKIISEKFGKSPAELIFITDTVGDVHEAAIAGVPTIVVTWGLHQKEDFEGVEKGRILAFVNSAQELLDFLKTNFSRNEIDT